MHILITGGSGLIGQAFIKSQPNNQYTVLTRQSMVKAQSNIHFIASLTELKNLNDFDVVINLAGEPIIDKFWSAKQKKIIQQSRWGTTQHLIKLFEQSHQTPHLLISGSAIGIYGNQGAKELTEQDVVYSNEFACDLCWQWEQIALQAAVKTRVVNLRTGIVLSAKGGALKKMCMPFKLGLGSSLGSGQQMMSWIHINDHVKAIQHIIEHSEIKGAVNMVAPNSVTNKVFSHALANTFDKKVLIFTPAIFLKLLMGERSCLLLDSQNIIPNKLLDSGFKFEFNNIDAALKNLL